MMSNCVPSLSSQFMKMAKRRLTRDEMEKHLTLRNVFEVVPQAQRIMSGCKFRKSPARLVSPSMVTLCYEDFEVIRIFKTQYICYVFTKAIQQRFFYDMVRNDLLSPGLYYQVSLDKKLVSAVKEFQLTIHGNDVWPRGNRVFPVTLNKMDFELPKVVNGHKIPEKERQVEKSEFTLSYDNYKISRLPAPFKTRCIDYKTTKFSSQQECIDTCLIEQVVNISGKVPFSIVTNIEYRLHTITADDNLDQSIQKMIITSQTKCRNQCSKPLCFERLYRTYSLKTSESDDFTVRVLVMSKPKTIIQYEQLVSFSTYSVQFLSCFGIWFTVDFTSIIDIIQYVFRLYRNI